MSSKPTPGPVEVIPTEHRGYVIHPVPVAGTYCTVIVPRNKRPDDEVRANSLLVAEAFNTLHETGLTPQQLREQRDELMAVAKNAAATIGALYEWLDQVEQNGGATSLSGVASCHAFLKSMRKNGARTDQLIMRPLRAAIAKVEGRS